VLKILLQERIWITEFIEVPLDKHDKALKENTEIMLREQLRQSIKDKLPL
jgi:hypothetical protein